MAMDMVQFGALVRARRTQRGMTLQSLALEALGNEDRKGYVSQIENAKLPNVTALTVQKLARVLEIPRSEIDGLLGVIAPGAAEVRADIDALRHEKGSLEAALSDLRTLTRAQLIALAAQFEVPRPWEDSDAALVEVLGKKAEDWRALRAQVEAIPQGLRQLSNLKGAAQAAFSAGRFDDVEDLLQRVHQVEVEEAARTAELRAETALLRGRVDQACALLAAAADSFAEIDPLEPARRRFDYATWLYSHGLRYGGKGLRLAATMWNAVATDAVRGHDPWLWGKAQNNLGAALRAQGSRTGGAEGAEPLGQAVAAYRAALEVRTRADHPLDWAATQNNLGIALRERGCRTGGAEGAGLLGQAVDAYRAALEVRTRADHPVDWAMTQNNLGAALRERGSRTGGAEGEGLLGQAVAAYRAALEVRTRADHPVDWAMTQNNLGAALQEQGRRTAGAEGAGLPGQAVDAYSAALEVFTRADHPVAWATTQNNLGNALRAQCARTSGGEPANGAALLGQAVAAYRAALEVHTRADHPVAWATTQNNLGNALSNQGERTGGAEGAELLGQAVAAYRAALEVRTRADHPVDWAMTQENLALTHMSLADHDSCADPVPHLRAALTHVEAALEVFDAEHMPYNHQNATALRDRLRARLGGSG
ncbi:helix-turn-helix transcriptional regulator [Aquibium sp. LZ166]|uniref:Helix-turn-helix transcriptional regulator n=1 Tax=Aquibium pacificus TaxID=3153579 RepID=A0ABV3SNL1_9HYPH